MLKNLLWTFHSVCYIDTEYINSQINAQGHQFNSNISLSLPTIRHTRCQRIYYGLSSVSYIDTEYTCYYRWQMKGQQIIVGRFNYYQIHILL
jgi:hypothetical protein